MDVNRASSPPPEKPPKRGPSLARELALVMELPLIPVVAVLVGGGLGYLVDTRLHTFPLFAAAFGLVGFLAGIRELVRRLAKQEKDNG